MTSAHTIRRSAGLGAVAGVLLGCIAFHVFDHGFRKPAGCDGLLMGAIHCFLFPLFGLLAACGAAAVVGALVGIVSAVVRRT